MKLFNLFKRRKKFSSSNYWEQRYLKGGNSGAGSYGEQAAAKALVLNELVKKLKINSVTELGCGDGNQLEYSEYPTYIGLDVSPKAVEICQKRFDNDDSKTFELYSYPEKIDDRLISDVSLSLEVIFHLVEDEVYLMYLDHLVRLSNRYVILFSTDYDLKSHKDKNGVLTKHVRHRAFQNDIRDRYSLKLLEIIHNPYKEKQESKFYVYEKS